MILNETEIRKILPQSYPFLMIDRIVEFEKDERLTAIKNVTANEWFFEKWEKGDSDLFENKKGCCPFFPETLIIEAAAQAALILYHLSKVKEGERPKYILGKTKAEFEDFVFAGDELKLKAYANKMLDTGGYSQIEVSKNRENIAKVEIIYSVVR